MKDVPYAVLGVVALLPSSSGPRFDRVKYICHVLCTDRLVGDGRLSNFR